MEFQIMASCVATLVIATVVHAGAQVLFARLGGFRIARVSIGAGPRVARTKSGETVLDVCILPLPGRLHAVPGVRRKPIATLLLLAAGPLSIAALIALTITFGKDLSYPFFTDLITGSALTALSISLLCSLWPRRMDGADMADAADDPGSWRANFPPRQAHPHRVYIDALLSHYAVPGQPIPPESQVLREIMRSILSRHRPPREAFADFKAKLEELAARDLAPHERLLVLDLLVTEGLAEGDKDLDADLDRWSAKALALAPDIATIRASRASVLIDTGQFAEGLEMLEQAEDGTAMNDCLVGAFRALALHGLGRKAEALEEFARAQALFSGDIWPISSITGRIAKTIGQP